MKPARPSTRLNTTRSISRPDTSRSSLNSSMVSVTLYPRCNKKKQHAKEMMNLVCLSQACKNNGPICSMCKSSDHSGHIVIPMKGFLTKLLDNIKKAEPETKNTQNIESIPEEKGVMIEETPVNMELLEQKIQTKEEKQRLAKEDFLTLLESQKIEMFAVLSHQVNKIAAQIQKIERKICEDFQNLQNQIQILFQTQSNACNLIEELMESPPNDSDRYCSQVGYLMNILQIKSKDEYFIKSDFCEEKISSWKKKGLNFVNNIDAWAQKSTLEFGKIFQESENTKNTGKINLGSVSSSEFHFSAENKLKSLVLTGNKSVKQTQKTPGIALLDGPSIKGKKIRFKIKGLNTNIGVGIGLKDVIKSKGFKPSFSSIGHGTFMGTNNTYVYSHHEKTSNMVMQGISFINGAEITLHVKADSKVLQISKKGDAKQVQISLKKMSDAEWKQAVFCVLLGGTGDSIQLLEN